MVVVFAVFLLAIVVVLIRPEGRASRIARLRAVADQAYQLARALLSRGQEALDQTATRLSTDRRHRTGLDQLLSEPRPVTHNSGGPPGTD